MPIIKKKYRLVKFIDKNKIRENNNFTGVVLYSKYTKKIIDINRFLLNFTKIYLDKNGEFYMIDEVLDIDSVYNYILKKFKLSEDDIIDIDVLYRFKNSHIYLVEIDYNKVVKNYDHKIFLDFYNKDIYDLYENILVMSKKKSGLKNIHVKNNIRGSNILIKLEYIYKALIGKYNMEDRFNDATNNDSKNNDSKNNESKNNESKNIKYI